MDKPKSQFDWVSARDACSTRAVFEALKQRAADDVKTINALRGKSLFAIQSNASGDLFSVVRQEDSAQRAVNFSVADSEIAIKPSSGSSFRVTLALNESGECKVKIKGRDEELEHWQVLRIALEDLFFDAQS